MYLHPKEHDSGRSMKRQYIQHSDPPVPLYAGDEDIARLVLGRDARLWPAIVAQLEREGLPPRRALIGGLRYVPAILEFFDRREGLAERDLYAKDGPERFDP